MTADTITISAVADLALTLRMAADRVAAIHAESKAGELLPHDAAEEIAEIMRNLNAAAR